MSFSALPEEVKETILLYVNKEQLPTLVSLLGIPDSERFWKRVCLQNGYRKLQGDEEEPWKRVFCRNINWFKASFRKSEINVRDLVKACCKNLHTSGGREPCADCRSTVRGSFSLLGHRIMYHNRKGVSFFDHKTWKECVEVIQGEITFRGNHSRNKIVVENLDDSGIIVYSYDRHKYQEVLRQSIDFTSILVIDGDGPLVLTDYDLTDDYFAFKSPLKIVKIVDLNTNEEWLLDVVPKKAIVLKMFVCTQILNFVIFNGDNVNFILKRYNLKGREWLEDIALVSGIMGFPQFPQVKMNQSFLVSWNSHNADRGVKFMKIWSLESGSGRASYINQVIIEKILWLLMEANYVVYSSSNDSFFVVDMNNVNSKQMMPMSKDRCLGQNIISNILVLSYPKCFKLVDYKKQTYLREVVFDCGVDYLKFCINEYFYVAYNFDSTTGSESHNKMLIYDFRSQPSDGED